MTVVAIGDSITFGQHLPVGVPAWPALIGAVGRGVCGETTRQALERFPRDVQTHPAAITILQWGLNDANRWPTDRGLPRVTLDAYAANLTEMIHRCRVFDTTPMLCTITPSFATADHAEDVAEYSLAVGRVSEALEVQTIDVRSAFLARSDGGRRLLLADGIHLAADGHTLFASVAQATLLHAQVAA